MGAVISFVSLKGGVGKTTVAAALATELAQYYGKKVLLIDANFSAPNLGLHMDIVTPGHTIHDVLSGIPMNGAVHDKFGVDVVPGNFMYDHEYSPLKLRSKIAAVRKDYDFIILDSSPSLNDELFSSLYASDSIFLVTTPDYPTLSCSLKLAKIAKQRDRVLSGIILNRVSGKNYQLGLKEVQDSVSVPVVAMLKNDERVSESLAYKMPVTAFDSYSSFSKEIRKLGASLCNIPEKQSLFKRIVAPNMRPQEVNREVLRKQFYTSIFKE